MTEEYTQLRATGLNLAFAGVLAASILSPNSVRAEPEEAKPNAGYEKGFYISHDDAFSLHIQGRTQLRLDYEILEGGENEVFFSVPRARLKLSGHAHTPDLKYAFQADFGKGSVSLKDYFIDYALADLLVVRAGQYKRPFSRQQITSSGSLEFVDRSITDSAFGAGRDIGIMLHNNYEKSPQLEYALGLFNGDGDKAHFSGNVLVDPATGEGSVSSGKFSNVPKRLEPTLVARIGYNSEKFKGYKEVDFDGGPLRWGIAASALADFDADNDNSSHWRAESDFMLKAYGASSTGGVYVSNSQDGPRYSDRGLEAWGLHMQAGYLIAKLVQPALRFATVRFDDSPDDLRELTAALSVYPFKHGLKWQTEASQLKVSGPEGTTDYRIRSQLQLAF